MLVKVAGLRNAPRKRAREVVRRAWFCACPSIQSRYLVKCPRCRMHRPKVTFGGLG